MNYAIVRSIAQGPGEGTDGLTLVTAYLADGGGEVVEAPPGEGRTRYALLLRPEMARGLIPGDLVEVRIHVARVEPKETD